MGANPLNGRVVASFLFTTWIGLSGCSASGGEGPAGSQGSDGEQDGGTGSGAQDTTPPVILEGAITTDDAGNASIWWLTDELATATLDYGLSEEDSVTVPVGDGLEASHRADLTGLIDGQRYWFQTRSTDAAGNTFVSAPLSFVQGDTGNDSEGPTISQVVAEVDGADVAISWVTSEPATSLVEYGVQGALDSMVQLPSEDLSSKHALTLSGLEIGVIYDYRVVSTDLGQNTSTSAVMSFFTGEGVTGAAEISGDLVAWHPLEFDFRGAFANEGDPGPNPFLDYRLSVTFEGPSGQTYEVPGFFDGDGAGGGEGDVWSARFSADEGGTWSYSVAFRSGEGIAVSADAGAGVALAPDGASGTFTVAGANPEAEGFLAKGRLEYVGEHYLRFAEGEWFLKGGTDSPENFLGYHGFDNTVDQPGGASTSGLVGGVHRYASHVADFADGDPLFESEDTGADSRGIIGALNYLASVHVNSVYFLPMNLGGDGRETYPFTGAIENGFDKTHYDISKLRQWNAVLEHASRRGILLHFVLAETESGNEGWLDGGSLGVERKLFYREMIARFGHHLAIKWNLSEENDFSGTQVRAFADYIQALDPYGHPIAFHTHYLGESGSYGDYDEVLGDPRFSLTSIQGAPEHAGAHTEKWRQKSGETSQRWVIDVDELGPASEGLTAANVEQRRKTSLWDVYLSGGNIEWYAGYHDLPLGGDMRLEDFRTREEMWNYMWYARRFLQENLRFWEMQPMDTLVTGETGAFGGAEVFAKANDSYAVYYPDAASTGTLDLTGASGSFTARWYNPRSGEFVGTPKTVTAGVAWNVGSVPSDPGSGEQTFVEQGGLVVMQSESVAPVGDWVEETATSGYTGDSYFRWNGPDYFNDPGHGILRYPIEVTSAGEYQLRIHNRHDHPAPDQENDCWVRLDGGTWVKVFSNNGAGSVGVWNWLSTFEYENGDKEAAHYNLSAGPHVLEISGRSHNYKMDRVHLYQSGVSDPQSLSLPESDTTTSGSGSGAGEDWVLLLKR